MTNFLGFGFEYGGGLYGFWGFGFEFYFVTLNQKFGGEWCVWDARRWWVTCRFRCGFFPGLVSGGGGRWRVFYGF